VDIETGFILLFVVATGVAVAVRRTRIPYTVALVLAGLALGTLRLFPAPALTKTLLFSACSVRYTHARRRVVTIVA